MAGFSILVGGFGIANIMFVSVKERTHIIGIQKSLGAKNYFILLQFLFEAMFLSLLGGVGGMMLVYLATFVPLGSLTLILTPKNIILGTLISSVIGIVSGLVPRGGGLPPQPGGGHSQLNESVMDTHQVLEGIKQAIREKDPAAEAYLFGSRATGTPPGGF